MKTLKLSLFAVVGALFFVSNSANAQTATAKKVTNLTETKTSEPSKITWTEDVFNFGEVEKGHPASHEFTFKNTTDQTILITHVKASCGCTATNYTKTPIKPGETGSVTATYNAANPGNFTKTITVTTNDTDVKKVLTIKGKVVAQQ
ncbi:DUF1573 domain-containing protein [Flavobacterium rakeshii]|uniref:DUF1573 domain-containing protein n=1 Tax=Flavobacterium rakeshii TaxID=1038845 RepID=A0A6N8HHW0_9FLAO|nr:DUF1573 domain-containing protein [Flavobacterium rakeshii]MEE1897372.1 DUF1573 domain-containing protein [Flavobacterium rakeshii]MUV05322.1 DUF1573 domain-containing protein [Flavobacterium rakeshii]